MKWRKLQFAVALAVFLGWVGWLAWQTRDVHEPIVSRSQYAAGDVLIRAKLVGDEAGVPKADITIEEILPGSGTKDAPREGEPLTVSNVRESGGFRGDGSYLLILTREEDGSYRVTEPPSSPGFGRAHRPWVYPWSEGVRKQIESFGEG